MPDRFRKVKVGDPLTIPAPVWNEVLDALQWIRAQKTVGGASVGVPLRPGMIFVRNDSGANRQAFEVLGINGPILSPTDNADQFKFNPMVKGITPTVAAHTGKFVVCAEPIANGAVGRAWIFGIFPCQVAIGSASDTTADVKDTDATVLKSGTGGAAQILWSETGTGTKWAIVRVGGSGGDGGFWVRITGYSAISGAPNRFMYTGMRQEPYTQGLWRDASGGTVTPIYNSVEAFNGTSGVIGNSADLSKYPSGTTIKPIQGSPVLWCRPGVDCYGTREYWVQYENGMPELCNS